MSWKRDDAYNSGSWDVIPGRPSNSTVHHSAIEIPTSDFNQSRISSYSTHPMRRSPSPSWKSNADYVSFKRRSRSPNRRETFSKDYHRRERSPLHKLSGRRAWRKDENHLSPRRRGSPSSRRRFSPSPTQSKRHKSSFLEKEREETITGSKQYPHRWSYPKRHIDESDKSHHSIDGLEFNKELSIAQLYREMNEQERLRREIEEERRRIFAEEEMAILNQSQVTPCTSSTSMNPLFNQMTQAPPISLVVAKSPVIEKEELRPGNYLIAYWDAQVMGSKNTSEFITRIGSILPHGVSMEECIIPEDSTNDSLVSSYYVVLRGQIFYLNPITRKRFLAISLHDALVRFLEFLEKGISSVRPKYDGVVLLSFSNEIVPHLLKSFKKYGLWKRFETSVKGVSDVCSYISEMDTSTFPKKNGQIIPDFSYISAKVTGNRCKIKISGTENASMVQNMIANLIGSTPSYSNFLKTFTTLLSSKLVEKMMSSKSVQEKLELFTPLREYIVETWSKLGEESDLFTGGIYGSFSSLNEENSQIRIVSKAYCRILIDRNLDLERMTNIFKNEGLSGLELALQTTLRKRMTPELKKDIDQTMKLINITLNFIESCNKDHSTSPSDNFSEQKQSYSRPMEDSEYSEKYTKYNKFRKSFPRNIVKDVDRVRRKSILDMLTNVLIQSGLEYDFLSRVYVTSRMSQSKNRHAFRRFLHSKIKEKYAVFGPSEVDIRKFIEHVLTYFGNIYHKIKGVVQVLDDFTFESSQETDSNFDEESRADLYPKPLSPARDLIYSENGRSLESLAASLTSSLLSHSSIKVSSQREQYARKMAYRVKDLLKVRGFTHMKLESLYEISRQTLRMSLFSVLRDFPIDLSIFNLSSSGIVSYLEEYIHMFISNSKKRLH